MPRSSERPTSQSHALPTPGFNPCLNPPCLYPPSVEPPDKGSYRGGSDTQTGPHCTIRSQRVLCRVGPHHGPAPAPADGDTHGGLQAMTLATRAIDDTTATVAKSQTCTNARSRKSRSEDLRSQRCIRRVLPCGPSSGAVNFTASERIPTPRAPKGFSLV